MKSTDTPVGAVPTPLPRVLSEPAESPTPTRARPSRTWSVFIFMKPDETLEKAAIDDVDEMKTVGRLDHAYVAVQVERVNDVERLEIDSGQERLHASPDRPRPVEMERRIESFMEWGMKAFPSTHRLAVLWGHARGVGFELGPPDDGRSRPVDVFAEWAPASKDAGTGPGAAGGRRRGRLSDGLTIPLLAGVVKDLKSRASGASNGTPRHEDDETTPGHNMSLDVLGLDSCYMSGIECGYQLHGCVDYLVASESFMLNQGWDYSQVLGALARPHGTSPEGLGEAIVRHVTTLPGAGSISMLRLKEMPDLVARVRTLVRALREVVTDGAERRALKIVLSRVSFLKVRQFLDLRDLCHKLTQNFDGAVASAAADVLERLPAVVFHQAHGVAAGTLNGLSIFYPYVRASAMSTQATDIGEVNAIVSPQEYRQLAFVKDTGWGELLDDLYGE
jgi:hypothetical protein